MLLKNSRLYLVLAWGIVICIIVLSLIPGTSFPKYRFQDLLAIDKLGHLIFYGSAAWCFSKHYYRIQYSHNDWIIGISLFFLGIGLECLQFVFNQGRSFDMYDILANGLGIYIGLKFFK